jgi:hypothetical protein
MVSLHRCDVYSAAEMNRILLSYPGAEAFAVFQESNLMAAPGKAACFAREPRKFDECLHAHATVIRMARPHFKLQASCVAIFLFSFRCLTFYRNCPIIPQMINSAIISAFQVRLQIGH